MSRKIAIRTAAVAIALGAMTSVALAESVQLTDAQMDQVAAGYGPHPGSQFDDTFGLRMPFRGNPTDMVAIGPFAYNFDDLR